MVDQSARFSDYQLACVVLAAGQASRFGGPKQIAPVGDNSLLNLVLSKYKKTCANTWVVLGANSDLIVPTLGSDIRYTVCEQWHLGQSKSLQHGLEKLSDKTTHVLLGLGDQIAISVEHLKALHKLSLSAPKSIIAAAYKGILGVPAIFPRAYFSELLTLSGDTGARSILKAHSHAVKSIAMPEAALDIDTPQDLENWKQTST